MKELSAWIWIRNDNRRYPDNRHQIEVFIRSEPAQDGGIERYNYNCTSNYGISYESYRYGYRYSRYTYTYTYNNGFDCVCEIWKGMSHHLSLNPDSRFPIPGFGASVPPTA
jgi:hypothetical protein